jgi:hypothetical protein
MDTLISILSKLFCLKADSNEQGTGNHQPQQPESPFWSETSRIPSSSDSAPWGSIRSSAYGTIPSVNLGGNRSHYSPSCISSDFRVDLGSFPGARGIQSPYHVSVSGSHHSRSAGRSRRTGSYRSTSGLPPLGSMSSVRPRQGYPHICEVANYF